MKEGEMNAKKIEESRVTLSQMMGMPDANTLGNVHGGVLMKLVDEAGALAAMRHAGKTVVTVALDSMTFREPIRIGAVVILDAELTYVGRTSMEVRVEVRAEHPITGEKTHTNSAFLVYVALDENSRPTEVPPLHIETDQEQQRWENARQRQAFRKAQSAQEAEISKPR